MNRNIGGFDRGVRILGGLILILLAVADRAGAWAWLGFIPVILGFVGWCPLFRLLGVDSASPQFEASNAERAAL